MRIGQYAQRIGIMRQIDLVKNPQPEFFKDEDKTFVDTSLSYSDFKQKILRIEHSNSSLLDKGLQIKKLSAMMNERNVPPLQSHYKPMLHLLASAGMVDDTYALYYQATDQHFHDHTDSR